ncbi:MAG: asparagine synthase (glutamine-hydrolyzing) [Bacteroidota bacterium]
MGAFSTTRAPLPITGEQAAAALDTIRHRGPDDSGVWWSADRSVLLGHRRLSIIDLSAAGHQPMTNEDGTIWIIFNGEIYNFADLHSDLEDCGHTFRSRTDTEVIIHGYEEYGTDIIRRLRGMFAFALYDSRNGQLLIARDRLGVKPLYYAWSGDTLYFASEIKPILDLPGIEKKLDTDALREYMAFGKVYPPRTMFGGVSKFPAAHFAIFGEGGELERRKYWTPYRQYIEFPDDAGEPFYVRRTLQLLENSVELRMVSDVPVGVFLSGGVDSTANVALMSRVSGRPVRTFTAGFRGQHKYDEREHARAAAKHYKTLHEEVEIDRSDLVDALPRLAYYLDEPVADPTVVPIYFLSQLARRSGTPVILNGDGADELFCGYRKYLSYLRVLPLWRFIDRIPPSATRSLARLLGRRSADGVLPDLLERSALNVEMYIGSTSAVKSLSAFSSIRDLPGAPDLYGAVTEAQAEFARERRGNNYVEWLSYWGTRSEVENVFLYRADRMGMANSIEIRVPFLDHALVEFAMQMPQALKHRDGETKYILKKALEGIVPDEFLYRKKQGFCVPLREWAGPMMDEKIFSILPVIGREWGVITSELIAEATSRLASDPASDSNGSLSWMLYNLAVWYERWFME